MASLGRESFPGGTAFCAVACGKVMGQPGDVEEASRKAMGTSSAYQTVYLAAEPRFGGLPRPRDASTRHI